MGIGLILLLCVFGILFVYICLKTIINGVYLLMTIKPGNVYQQINDNSRNPFFIMHDVMTYHILDIKKQYVKYAYTFESRTNGNLTTSASRENSCHIVLFCFCEILGFKKIKK